MGHPSGQNEETECKFSKKATIASKDTQMTGYEKATLTLATFKTSDVGE